MEETRKFSYAACQWIEKQSELTGRHIHHALCGHGGEYYVACMREKRKFSREGIPVDEKNSHAREIPVDEKNSHAREIPVDGYEPKSNTTFQYHGCNGTDAHVKRERKKFT